MEIFELNKKSHVETFFKGVTRNVFNLFQEPVENKVGLNFECMLKVTLNNEIKKLFNSQNSRKN